jgi:hypothetical protein
VDRSIEDLRSYVSGFGKLFGKLFGSCEAGTLYRTGTFTGSEIFGLHAWFIELVMGLVGWLVR